MTTLIAYTTRMNIYAVLLLLAGLIILYLIGRRRFYRRNGAGLQQFKNYRSAIVMTVTERIGQWLGRLLVLAALLLYLLK